MLKDNRSASPSFAFLLLLLLLLCGGCAQEARIESPPENLAMASVRTGHPGSVPSGEMKGREPGSPAAPGRDDAVAQKGPGGEATAARTPDQGSLQAPSSGDDTPAGTREVPAPRQLPPRQVTTTVKPPPPLEGGTAFGDVIRETLRQEMPGKNPAVVDIVFCLDTSSSMGIFTESAKKELFAIAQEVTRQKAGAKLRVALICYGSPCYDASRGWVKVMTDFTDDLDAVQDLLSKIVICGGDEYVARALSEALQLNRPTGNIAAL